MWILSPNTCGVRDTFVCTVCVYSTPTRVRMLRLLHMWWCTYCVMCTHVWVCMWALVVCTVVKTVMHQDIVSYWRVADFTHACVHTWFTLSILYTIYIEHMWSQVLTYAQHLHYRTKRDSKKTLKMPRKATEIVMEWTDSRVVGKHSTK
jgi:hypothetical protein